MPTLTRALAGGVAGALLSLSAAPALAATPHVAAAPTSAKYHLGKKVELFKSVAGVKVGMSPKQVKKAVGKPTQTQHYGGKVGAFYYRHGSSPVLNVTFDTTTKGDPVQSVFCYSTSVHTAKGIHPGSTLKALKHAYGKKGLKKQSATTYSLFKGKPGTPGSRRTDFGLIGKKVVVIGVQAVF